MLSVLLVLGMGVGPSVVFDLPAGLTEVSGMAYGASGRLYVHSDSGAPSQITALTASGEIMATYELGVQARDWEAMAAGPAGTLLIADIGDNSGIRTRGVLVHRITEPSGPGRQVDPDSIRLTYSDSPHDAETLLVHPRTGQTLVVTKAVFGQAVYAAPQPLRPGLLRKVADVRTQHTGTPGGPVLGVVSQRLITGGAVSPDGSRIALRTYTDAYLYQVPGSDLIEAFARAPRVLALPESTQGEALTWSPDGQFLLVTGEGSQVAVSRVPVPPPGPADQSGPQQPTDKDRTALLLAFTGVAAVLALAWAWGRRAGGSSRRQRAS